MIAILALAFGLAPTLTQEPAEADFYALDYLQVPEGEVLEVGGLAFLPDGSLLASTRRGRVWWIENPTAQDPAKVRFHRFAEGLHEGLGLRVVGDDIYVVQRSELSRLVDADGDRVCDRIEVVSMGWGMSGNYHEFAFGLPQDDEGNFYVSTNVGFSSPEWWLGNSLEPYRGWVLRIGPDGTVTPWASGVRSPAGLGQDSAGRIYYTDNQGDWMPVCGLFHVQQGAFFGHPASLRWREDFLQDARVPSMIEAPQVERTPPALWIPYEWSRSTGSVLEDQSGGNFGPFAGDLFLAELTNGMVLRAMLEEVEGHVQGACLPFRQEIGSAFRLAQAPDGSLFVGMTNRGWGGLSPGSGIARVRWTGETPQEVSDVALRNDGFAVRWTRPLAQAPDLEQVTVTDYDYNWWWDYGSPIKRERNLTVVGCDLDDDGQGMHLRVEGLQAGRNVRVRLEGIGLLHEEFDYTIHRMPGSRESVHVAKWVEPPQVNQHPDEGWLTLTWLDPFDGWQHDGWELVNAELDPQDATRFVTTPGNGALVNTGYPAQPFVSEAEFGDVEFRFAFQLPAGGDSGLYFQGRYELQLVDDASQCLGIIGSKGPRAKGYRGPGEWHVVTGKFYAPRFDGEGRKIAPARFEQIQADGVMVIGSAEVHEITPGGLPGPEQALGPLWFQGSAGRVAIGDVRVRPFVEGEPEHDPEAEAGWVDLAEFDQPVTSYELRGSLTLSDQGGAALWLGGDLEDRNGPRLIFDHNSPAEAHTGSLLGFALDGDADGVVRTQLLQPGVPFDLRVRCVPYGPGVSVDVWLNGARMNSIQAKHPPVPGPVRLEAQRVPGTELEVHSLQIRSL